MVRGGKVGKSCVPQDVLQAAAEESETRLKMAGI
jgi:hypothetical protein